MKQRKAFAKRQREERVLFMFMLEMISFSWLVPPVRTIWCKERSSHWWEHVVNTTFTPHIHDWLQNFRLSRDTFHHLCDKLKAAISKTDTIMRNAVQTEKRVAITLWFLASGSDYRTVGHLFGVAKATVCVVVKQVCASIVKLLLPSYIQMPTGSALKEIVDGFKTNHDFPQCAGAVDGCHVPIVSPQQCPADYFNRKGWHSIILQGTVDDRGRFIDVYIGWPGRVHDARVFSNSSLYKKGQSNSLFPDLKQKIAGKDIPIVLLGDPAYPLLQWLMKAFPNNGHLTSQQKTFNYRLSKARVVVEHCYGRLKGRWRCLLKRLDVDVCDAPEIVAACCVLHNVCEIHGDAFDEQWMEGVERDFEESSSATAHAQPTESSINIRNAFMSYFSQ